MVVKDATILSGHQEGEAEVDTCMQQATELVGRERSPRTPLTVLYLLFVARTSLQNDCASVAVKNVQNANHQSKMYNYKT